MAEIFQTNQTFKRRVEHSMGNISELISLQQQQLQQQQKYHHEHQEQQQQDYELPQRVRWVSSPATVRGPLDDVDNCSADTRGQLGLASSYNQYPSCGSSHLNEFGNEAALQTHFQSTSNQAWKDFLHENSVDMNPVGPQYQRGLHDKPVKTPYSRECQRQMMRYQNRDKYSQEFQSHATISRNGAQYTAECQGPIMVNQNRAQHLQEGQHRAQDPQEGQSQIPAFKEEPIELEANNDCHPLQLTKAEGGEKNSLRDASSHPYNGLSSTFLSLRSQLSSILDAFTIISGKLSLDSNLAEDFILNHQRQKSLEKTTLMSQLSMIASTLTEFASSQFLFSSLCKEDQTTLLKNNIPLYLQYILARYFSAETGLEQLNWILEGQINIESIEMVTSLSRVGLKEYNTSVNLFPTSEMVEIFSHYVRNIGLFYPFPQHCNGLIANMILYYVDESIAGKLKEEKRISCIFEEAKELVKIGFDHLDRKLNFNPGSAIGPLMNTLSKMKIIFGNCRVQRNRYTNIRKTVNGA